MGKICLVYCTNVYTHFLNLIWMVPCLKLFPLTKPRMFTSWIFLFFVTWYNYGIPPPQVDDQLSYNQFVIMLNLRWKLTPCYSWKENHVNLLCGVVLEHPHKWNLLQPLLDHPIMHVHTIYTNHETQICSIDEQYKKGKINFITK